MKPNHALEKSITGSMLEKILTYDPDTGIFRMAKTRGGAIAGSVTGRTRPDGYVQVKINERWFLAQRLAWVWMYGEWPKDGMTPDHIDRDKGNNRITNLRLATSIQNAANSSLKKNNKSGYSGVFYLVRKDGRSPRWLAYIRVEGKRKRLGFFKTKEEAIEARRIAAETIHGKYASHT